MPLWHSISHDTSIFENYQSQRKEKISFSKKYVSEYSKILNSMSRDDTKKKQITENGRINCSVYESQFFSSNQYVLTKNLKAIPGFFLFYSFSKRQVKKHYDQIDDNFLTKKKIHSIEISRT